VKLLVATRSAGKQREIRRMLALPGLEVVFPDDAGVPESPSEDALEVHDSFEANARAKALYFAQRTGLPTVADDAGLEVLSLGGFPGVRSKRWAGAVGTEAEIGRANIAALLQKLAGAPPERRRAQFRCVLAFYATPTAIPEVFDGRAPGVILDAPHGTGGFGYDPIFLSDDLGTTFGDAAPEAKDAVSHRGRAFAALRAALAPRLGPT
jgi:XTP/dITP diphosphohydrolase